MNNRTNATMALLAASMLGMTMYSRSANGRPRSDRMDPHTPANSREKQAKNRAARQRRGKR